MYESERAHAYHLLGWKPEDVNRGRTGKRDGPLMIEHHQEVGRLLDEHAEASLALAEVALHADAPLVALRHLECETEILGELVKQAHDLWSEDIPLLGVRTEKAPGR